MPYPAVTPCSLVEPTYAALISARPSPGTDPDLTLGSIPAIGAPSSVVDRSGGAAAAAQRPFRGRRRTQTAHSAPFSEFSVFGFV